MSYKWEKLFASVGTLVGSGDLNQRLMGAYMSLMRLNDDDFSGEQLKKFQNIMKHFHTGTPIGDEGVAQASINNMTELESDALAMDIVSLYDHITRGEEEW